MSSLRIGFVVSSVVLATIGVHACGKKGDKGDSGDRNKSPHGALEIGFTTEAANSLPQVAQGPVSLSAAGNISDLGTLKSFFRQECFMPTPDGKGYRGFCPDNVKAQLDAALADGTGLGDGTPLFQRYKLTSTTLIGLIYHAEMYSQISKISNDCAENGGAELAAANSPTFSSGETGGEPGKFVVTYPTGSKLFSCVKMNSWNDSTSYTVFGHENGAINVLTARYGAPYGSTPDRQTDIFQIYLAFEPETISSASPKPTFLAFNHPAAEGARAIVLTNLQDHRFAVKYQWGQTPIIALGKGGVNTDGTPVTGFYLAYDADGGKTYCVNNTDGTLVEQSESTDCSSDPVLKAAWNTMTPETVATYLGLSSTEQAAAVNYLRFFNSNGTAFEDSDRPASGCNDGDRSCYQGNKKNFPSRIE